MKIPHTSTPWFVIDNTEQAGPGHQVRVHGANAIAVLGATPYVNDETRANAAIIVKAVNMHFSAVDTLIETRHEIRRLNEAAGETVFNPAVTEMIDALIKEASEGSDK